MIDNKPVIVAYPVNHPTVVVQCSSDEIGELRDKMKSALRSWLEFNLKGLKQGEPFEYKEFTDVKKWLHKQNKAN